MTRTVKVKVVNGLKPCAACKKRLPVAAFGVTNRNASGYYSKCRACHASYARDRYHNKSGHKAVVSEMSRSWARRHPEAIKIIQRRYRERKIAGLVKSRSDNSSSWVST